MKVFKKNVYLGTISLCLKACKNKKSIFKRVNAYEVKKVKSNVAFIKIDDSTYIELEELIQSNLPKSLARKFVTQYKDTVEKSGQLFIDKPTPFYTKGSYNENDKVDVEEILNSTNILNQ